MFLYKFDIPMCFSSKSHDDIVKIEDINDHLTKKLNDNINLCPTIWCKSQYVLLLWTSTSSVHPGRQKVF